MKSNHKIRLIQCGVGGFGQGWLSITSKSEDFEVVAVVDISEANLKSVQTDLHFTEGQCFSDLESALAAVSADAILSVTPPPVHVQHARIAFGRGLHFMTEKPLADTLENAKEMIRLAGESGKQLMVSQQYRYNVGVQTLKSQLQTGAIGEFGHGHLDFYIPADFTGTFREKMRYPLLVDMAIHHMDLLRCVTGRDVINVTARSFRPAWSWYEHDPALKMLLELDGGSIISYSGDWSACGRGTGWGCHWRLQGATGSLHLEGDQVSLVRSERWGANPVTEEIPNSPLEHVGQHATLSHFAEAIRTDIEAPTSGKDNIKSLAVVMAAKLSAEEKRTVWLSELLQ